MKPACQHKEHRLNLILNLSSQGPVSRNVPEDKATGTVSFSNLLSLLQGRWQLPGAPHCSGSHGAWTGTYSRQSQRSAQSMCAAGYHMQECVHSRAHLYRAKDGMI